MAIKAIKRHGISIGFACQCLRISLSCYYYQAKLSTENEVIADWLLRLTTTHKRWCFGLCFFHLRNVRGFRLDNGLEYVAKTLIDWATDNQITLMYIQPGKPTQNAYVERFNRTVRHEWLDLHHFESVEQAQELATQWLWVYNNERPNTTAIGGIPPRWLQ